MKKNVDKTFPARTRVIGIINPLIKSQLFYLKEKLAKKDIVKNSLNNESLDIKLNSDNTLTNTSNVSTLDIRGKIIKGDTGIDLEPITISGEYWFSWKFFHSESKLIHV